jgi:hypothetical protein
VLKRDWIILAIVATLPVIFIAFGAVGVALASNHEAYHAARVMDMAKMVALITVPVGGILIAFIISRPHLDRDL